MSKSKSIIHYSLFFIHGLKSIIHYSSFIILCWKRFSKKQRIYIFTGLTALILILIPAALYIASNIKPASAAWFNDSWGYRQTVNITNSGTNQTDYQVAITLDTATLITAGKMQSNCNDIRITDINGKLLPLWIETGTTGAGGKACNASTTQIWVKVPSLPTSGQTIYLYYGNSSATNTQSGDKVFEFFDDFSGSSIDSGKWSQGTIGATSGTVFSESGGNLVGGNSNRYVQSTKAFTGNYAAQSRSFTTTDNVNGFSVVGFYASSSNSFGILDHNNSSYYRNDAGWTNFTLDGTSQWSRNATQVVGTTATYARTGETSGSSTATGITNSGLNAESIRLGARYDDSANNQDFVATWDWIFVKKAAATEPTVASPTNEEKSPAPVAYWKFDEGYGTNAYDSTSNNNNGTITGATWQSEDQCINGKCLRFNGSSSMVNITSSSSKLYGYSAMTISAWVKINSLPSGYYFIAGKESVYKIDINSNGTIRFLTGNNWGGSILTSQTILSPNQWYHIEATYDGTTKKLFFNGTQDANTVSTSGNVGTNSTYNVTIGARGTDYLNGFIDEPKIYSYARSTAQVKLDYASRGSKSGSSVSIGSSVPFLSNGLVGYWKQDEATWSGTLNEVVDSSGNGNNGQAQGATGGKAYPTGGKFGNGGYFDGVDDYVDSGNINNIFNFTSEMTLSAWIKPSSNGGVGMSVFDKSYASAYEMNVVYGAMEMNIKIGGTYYPHFLSAGSGTAPIGTWTHVLFTYSNGVAKWYVNGVLKSTKNDVSGDIGTSSQALRIGGNRLPFNGQIDEARVYNRALSPAEVQKLYNWAPGPVGYWNFEEGSGSTLFDRSSNGNNSDTFGGSPIWTTGKYGKAVNFDTNSYARKNSFSIGSDPVFTVSGWFKRTDSITGKGAWGIGAGGTSQQTISGYGSSGQKISIDLWGTSTYYADYDYPLNEWVYVAWVKTGSDFNTNTISIYVNGIKRSLSVTRDGSDTVSLSSGLTVGAIYNSSTYNAPVIIDDFKIYNYARTPGQIIEDMNAGHPIGGSPIASQMTYLKFDEGNGSVARDSGFARLNATINSGATFAQDGKFGKTLTFNGASGYVNWGDISNYDFNTSNYAISAWVKIPDTPNNAGGCTARYPIFYNHDYGYNLYIDSSRAIKLDRYYTVSNSYTTTSNTALIPNKWYHVVATENGGRMYLYINGVKEKDIAAPTTTMYYAAGAQYQPQIGRGICGGTTFFYKGQIDEFKLYNTALTADQVKLDMNQGKALVLGSVSDTSQLTGGSVASNSASAAYCIPGGSETCLAPIAEWNFEEKNGIYTNDSSGNGKTGTLGGDGAGTDLPTWSSGKIGSALKFDGSNDYVSTPLFNKDSITVEAWFNRSVKDTVSADTIFGNWRWAADAAIRQGYDLRFYLNDSTLDWIVETTNGSTVTEKNVSSGNLEENKWYHAVGTYDSTSGISRLYVNGSLVASSTANPGNTIVPQTTYTDTRIGYGPTNSGYFTGKIDQVKIYNYARSPAQVAWDYNQGKPIAHWKFDECQGTTAYDSSGNSNHGTITIGATVPQTTAGTCTSPTDGTGAWYNGRTGKYNSSLKFDGADDQVSIGDPVSGIYDFGTSNFSLSAWIKTTDNGQAIVAKQVPNIASSWNGFNFWISTEGKLQPTVDWSTNGSFGNIVSNTSVNDGGWKHVVFVMNGSDRTNWKIYINGNSDSFTESGVDLTGSGINNSTSLRIGNRDYAGGFFNGQIDDVRIYNYALTATQVKNVMNQGAAVRYGPSQGSP